MPNLEFKLLGSPQILLDGRPLVLQPRNSIKAKAILYYLAASGQPQSRERLAGLLWSDWPNKKARDYLRGEIHLLTPLKEVAYVEAEGRLSLIADVCTVDVTRFWLGTTDPASSLEHLHALVELYNGPFLEELETALENSAPLYVEWLTETRTQVESQLRNTLYRLAESCVREQRQFDLGIGACDRLLAEEPDREEVHRLKMRLLARDGQRAAALKQYDLCTTALLDELGVPPSDETNALYDRILAGEVGTAGADQSPLWQAAQPQTPPFQAVAPPAHFVGRMPEAETLASWLIGPQRGITVAVVGMGGAGKTALAAQLADLLRPQFQDGVLWAHVSSDTPLDILQSWSQSYGVDLSKISSLDARAAAMRNLLTERSALIVLDDVVSGKSIDSLLPGASRCPVLITARDRAEVAAYTTNILDLQELTLADSMEILTHVLGEALVQANRAQAEAICAILGGLPLAVEIAAQRILSAPRPSLARMAHHLQDAGDRLDHGISNRSVRTSFNVSWDALPANLQRLFAFLGLFQARSFSAETVASILDLAVDDAIDGLDGLVTLSMLRVDGERYVQHRLLADFAAEKLPDLLDVQAVTTALIDYYIAFVRMAAVDFARLDAEWENLLAALDLAHTTQNWDRVIAGVDAMTAPWFARARLAQARRGFELGLEAAETLNDAEHMARYGYYLGKILVRQDEYAAARNLLSHAMNVFRDNEQWLRTADALVDLADVAFEEGDLDEATEHLAEAEIVFEARRHKVGSATAKSRQALVLFYRGGLEDAAHLCREGLEQLDDGDGEVVRSRMLRLLTDIAIQQRQFDLASEYCRQAQVVNSRIKDQTESAALLFAQAKLDYLMDFDADALDNARQSVQLYSAMGDRKASAVVYHMISKIQLKLGEPDAATAAARQGLAIAKSLNDRLLVELCNEQIAAAQSYA